VPRLQVLTLADIMTPATRKPSKALKMAASTPLETAMLALTGGEDTIAVMADDRLLGKVSRQDIINAVEMVS